MCDITALCTHTMKSGRRGVLVTTCTKGKEKSQNGRDCALVCEKSVITDWLYEREIFSCYTNNRCFLGLNLLGITKLKIKKRRPII